MRTVLLALSGLILVSAASAADEMQLLMPANVAIVTGADELAAGSGNEIAIRQSGDNNRLSIDQTGFRNIVSVVQAGSGGHIDIVQSGSGNTALVYQH